MVDDRATRPPCPQGGDATCQQVIEFLDGYVDGTIGDTERLVFEEHLRLCRGCAAYLAEYRASVAMARATATLDARPVPRGLVQAILKARAEADGRGKGLAGETPLG